MAQTDGNHSEGNLGKRLHIVQSEVLTEVKIHIVVVWIMTLESVVGGCCFQRTYYLHLQGSSNRSWESG